MSMEPPTELHDTLVRKARSLCGPLSPEATDCRAQLRPLADIRCVLFDIYGTLLISGTGDVGADVAGQDIRAMEDTLAGEPALARLAAQAPAAADLMKGRIHDLHARSRARGLAYPEVDIVQVWQWLLARLNPGSQLPKELLFRVAMEHECRVNPVWPMPGASAILELLSNRGLGLGIVSNAQFYTPLLLESLLGGEPAGLGFDPRLCAFSYRHGIGKPDSNLFAPPLQRLERELGCQPGQVLYVGNDMLKDIWAASQHGCRTALFAGDRRSLRLRRDDPRCAELRADLVITQLSQLGPCLEASG